MDDNRAELISRLFALLTAQLEDGATLALEGQGRQTLAAQDERAQTLEAQVRDAHTIAQALVDITSRQQVPERDIPQSS
jgi:hypothetical protein